MKRYILILAGLLAAAALIVTGIFHLHQPSSYCAISKSEGNEISAYLKQNSSAINLNDDKFQGLNLLDADAEKNIVFLSGEAHAIAKNQDLELYFLRYFNQRHGVRYLLTEQGYAVSQLINQYLNTGDEAILQDIYSQLEGTAAWNKEAYNFWVSLRQYNNTLPPEKKITVIGIDIEHQPVTALKYLCSLLPSDAAPEIIAANIEDLRKSYNNPSIRIDVLAAGLQRDKSQYPADYQKYLGNNYHNFSFVVDNIVNRYKCYQSSDKFDELREEFIRNNMVRILELFPPGKYYGEWGLEHTYLSDHGGQFGQHDCLATFLNQKEETTKGRVVSIAYFYSNCQQMTLGNGYGQGEYRDGVQVDLLNQVSGAELCLLKFTGSNSPFTQKPFFVADPQGGATTDYYQYGVVIHNSPAAHPYGIPGKQSR